MGLPRVSLAGGECCPPCTPPCVDCGDGCTVQIDCYTRALAGQKCGFVWTNTVDAGGQHYAQVVLKFWGSRSTTWTSEECGLNESYSIGNGEGNPLLETWTLGGGPRIETFAEGIWSGCPGSVSSGACYQQCDLANDGGNIASCDDGTNSYSGSTTACPVEAPSAAVTIDGAGVDFITWTNDTPPDPDFSFPYVDPNLPPGDVPDWTLEPGDTLPLHARWSKSWSTTYTSGYNTGSGGASEDCPVDVAGDWYSDITMSDEITTTELIDAITDFILNTTDEFDSHTMGAGCSGCFSISADESQAYYREAIVKLTNPSLTDTITVTWNVYTRAAAFPDAPEECLELCNDIGGDPDTTTPESTNLAPGASYERSLIPDTAGSGEIKWIDDVTCAVV